MISTLCLYFGGLPVAWMCEDMLLMKRYRSSEYPCVMYCVQSIFNF